MDLLAGRVNDNVGADFWEPGVYNNWLTIFYSSGVFNKIGQMKIETAIGIIKALPMDQAIQQIKSKISGLPETVVIDGNLKVILVKETNKWHLSNIRKK